MAAARLRLSLPTALILLFWATPLFVTPVGPAVASLSGPALPDLWSSPVTLRTEDGWYASPVHATLMPHGKVMLMGIERPTENPGPSPGDHPVEGVRRSAFFLPLSPPGTPLAPQLVVQSLRQPVDADNLVVGPWLVNDDLICSGHALMADGRFFEAGGTRIMVNLQNGSTLTTAPSYATVFDGATWNRIPQDMRGVARLGEPRRWYPTVTRLPDMRMLVTGGFDLVLPSASPNLSIEAYDPLRQAWNVTYPFGSAPVELVNSDDTHVFPLPSPAGPFDVLMLGEPAVPILIDSFGRGFSLRPPRPGSEQFQLSRMSQGGGWDSDQAPDAGSSSALLPIRVNDGEWGYRNGSVLVAGGQHGTTHIRSVDVFDPIANAWRPTIDMQIARHHPDTVLLPDGRVLIIAGHSIDREARYASYVDPRAGFALTAGASDGGEVRGYHNVALLLPDGRVLVGGGRDVDTDSSVEKSTFRYYYPSYMFAARPRILAAPETIGFDSSFFVHSDGPQPTEVLLMALGSMTHSFDQNQRSVQLQTTGTAQSPSGESLTIAVGPTPQAASPGYYMLFVLDAVRTPSVAKIVRVGA
ncbi:MAG: galactose oxidase-like domain-containing protein [Actinomycetota bacterium]